MSCFFFHMEGHAAAPEHVKMRLDDADEARSHAVVALGDLLRGAGASFWNGPDWQIDVTDESGRTVCTLKVQGRAAETSQADWPTLATRAHPAMAVVA